MSKASTLLSSIAGSVYSAGMGTSEEHIVIGRDRFIKVPDALKKVAVQFDHNVETVTFDCPRYWDDTDFSTLRVYINYTRSDGYEDSVVCDNVTVEEETIHFQWTISSNVTQVAGTLSFLICMKQVDSDGNESQHWNSEINSEMYISKGMETQEKVLADNPDLVTHIQNLIESFDGTGGGSGTVDPEEIHRIVDEYLAENPPGSGGADGVSPTVDVAEIEGGYRLTITDAIGTETIDIMNGVDGSTPQKGVDYFTDVDIQEVASEAAKLVSIDQVTPEQVVFPEGASTTYQIGKVTLTNGMGELVPAGGTLKDFFNQFIDEKNPTTTDPSVSLTFSQAKAYEVGTKVTPSYSASLNSGSYTYGPATGVVASAWEVTDTAGNTKKTTASGSFPELTVTDGISYKITAKATHNAGAVPVTNTGNSYAAGQIAAGSKSATSGAITGYRNTFYGTLTAKTTPTSDVIRGLASKSGKTLANGNSFTVTVPVGALRVLIAYPATLRDVNSIKDVNGLNAEISSGFTKTTLNVEGANDHKAISYKVYIMDFAEANDKANKFTVVI